MRIGTAGAFRIGLNEVSIGMPVPVLAMELARDRIAGVDLGRATLRAQIYGPDEAARVGYLDDVVPAGEVLARAKEEAGCGSWAMSRMAYHATKKRLRGKTIDCILSTLDHDMAAITLGGRAPPWQAPRPASGCAGKRRPSLGQPILELP